MKVLIEIPDKHRSNIKKKFNSKDTIDGLFDYLKKVEKASVEIIPDNATNGDAIKALYPNRTFFNEDSCCVTMKEYGKTEEDTEYLTYIDFDGDWWNTPYRKD